MQTTPIADATDPVRDGGPRYLGRPLPRPEEELVDQGLAFDVETLMSRRRMLGLGATALGLAACGGEDPGTAASSSPSSSTGNAVSAAAIPEETAGPYPGDGSNGPDVLEQSGVVLPTRGAGHRRLRTGHLHQHRSRLLPRPLAAHPLRGLSRPCEHRRCRGRDRHLPGRPAPERLRDRLRPAGIRAVGGQPLPAQPARPTWCSATTAGRASWPPWTAMSAPATPCGCPWVWTPRRRRARPARAATGDRWVRRRHERPSGVLHLVLGELAEVVGDSARTGQDGGQVAHGVPAEPAADSVHARLDRPARHPGR